MAINYQEINYDPNVVMTNEENETMIEKINAYEKSIKPRWWENIPLFGAITYSLRINNNFFAIGGQKLDKNVATSITKWLMFMLIIGFFMIEFLTPWFIYFIIKNALKKTKTEILANIT